MRTTEQLRELWAPPCKIRRATFTFWSGVAVTVDERVVPALHALDDVLRRWGYAPKSGQTWGFACRAITGGTLYSLHAFGIAVDINSVANPYGRRLTTDMPRGMVDEILAIHTSKGVQVWRWGGDYSGNKDAMHFECVASPAELAAGLASSTHTTAAVPSATEPTVFKTFQEADVQTQFVTAPPANGLGLAELFVEFGKEVVPVGEPCVHGPDPSAGDGWWPDTIGVTARAQPRGTGLYVTVAGVRKEGVAVSLWVSAA